MAKLPRAILNPYVSVYLKDFLSSVFPWISIRMSISKLMLGLNARKFFFAYCTKLVKCDQDSVQLPTQKFSNI